ncbi:hypothetical protein [Sulfuracidifex tepidarius]|nr:hypothetical protein [Sulfuracidifex tepidarius]
MKGWSMVAAGILASIFFAAVALYVPYVVLHSERINGVITVSEDGTLNEYNQTALLLSTPRTWNEAPAYLSSNYSKVIVLLLNYSSIEYNSLSSDGKENNTANYTTFYSYSSSTFNGSQIFLFVMNSSLVCSRGDTFSVYPDLISINASEILPLLISFSPNDSIYFPIYSHYYTVKSVRYTYNPSENKVYVQLYLDFHIKENQFDHYQVMIIVIPLRDTVGSIQNIVFIVQNKEIN